MTNEIDNKDDIGNVCVDANNDAAASEFFNNEVVIGNEGSDDDGDDNQNPINLQQQIHRCNRQTRINQLSGGLGARRKLRTDEADTTAMQKA